MLLNLLVKPAWLLVENQVQDQLGHAAMGTYMALFSFSLILGAGVDLGLNQFTTRQLAAAGGRQAPLLAVLFPLKWAVSLFFPGLVVLAGWLWGYGQQDLYLLLFIAGGYSFTQFVFFLRAILQGQQHLRADAWASVSERLLQLVLVAGLLGTGLTLDAFIYSRLVAIGLAFAILLGVVRHYLGGLRYRFSWRRIRLVLRGSLPFALIMLLYGLNEKVDMIMLERLSSRSETGIYAAAYRWVDGALVYLWLVLPVFFARFAGSLANRQAQQQLLRLGQVVVSVPLIFVGVFVLFYGRLLFWQYDHSGPGELSRMQLNLVVLFVHVMVQGLFALYSTLLTASNFEKPVSGLVLTSLILNVMLNSVLVPVYGSLAAAASTLACSLVVSGGYLYLVKSRMQLAVPWDLLLRLVLAGILLAALFALLQRFSLSWFGVTLLAGMGYVLLLFMLGLFSRRHLREVLRIKN